MFVGTQEHWWHSGKDSSSHCRRYKRQGFDPWLGKIPWRRKWQPIPVFFTGKFHWQRSLAGSSPWGHKESDTTERVCACARAHTHTQTHTQVNWMFLKSSSFSWKSPVINSWLGRKPVEEKWVENIFSHLIKYLWGQSCRGPQRHMVACKSRFLNCWILSGLCCASDWELEACES